ncbi:MAG: radical SAM protein [Candidatus Omnitrophota bacterium]
MKSQSYNNFWQRLHKSAQDKSFPLRVMFELTYRCNFNCKHCYVPKSYRKKGELKTKEACLVLDELKNIGCFYLGFTGGEVFLRKDILDVFWYAKRKGFEIIIYTNGSLIDKMVAKELKRIRVNKVDITIPAMSPSAFERISGVPGSREKVFAAINFLRENKVAMGFKTCVLKENESEIKDIQKFANSLGALHRLDDLLSPRLDGSMEPYKYRGTLLNANGRKSIDANMRESLNANHRESNANLRECCDTDICVNSRAISENSRLFKCGVGVSQAAITPLGELKPCLMIDYPKTRIYANQTRMNANGETRINANSRKLASIDSRGFALKDAWERLKEFVASIKPDKDYKCNRCELEPYCKWCPARGWLYNKTFTPLEKTNREQSSLTGFTSCEPESRKKAELIARALIL